MTPQLTLHCGGWEATRTEVEAVEAPAPKDRWHPISHRAMLQTVEAALPHHGIEVTGDAKYALGGVDGARFFGLLPVRRAGLTPAADWQFVLGIRNSVDKSFAAGLVAGTHVFICDNLCFSGTVRGEMENGEGASEVRRKHTSRIVQTLPALVSKLLGGYADLTDRVVKDFDALKTLPMDRFKTADFMINALRHGVVGPNRLAEVVRYMDNPPEGHDMSTGWGVFNAFTGALRGATPETILRESTRYTMLFTDLAHGREVRWPKVEGLAVNENAAAAEAAAMVARN